MNISELARRLRTTPDELREKLPMLGFDIGAKAIKVDDRLVNKITEKWSAMRKTDRLRAKYQQEEEVKVAAVARVKNVTLPAVITVRDFSTKLGLPITIVIGELMKNGILASLNERIDRDTASIIAQDLGYEVAAEEEKKDFDDEARLSADQLKTMISQEDESALKPRPPVVVVMGHVDHGKTKILDAIRKTNVMQGEAGGITQHIGAYQVEKKGKLITFIDTPGHEAFTVMRSRGARVADVAILVVAADDGVQQQTIEVIKIIDAAKLPVVVALNKIDKPGIDIVRVKTQLSEHGLIPEDFGGKVPMVPVSAKTGQGIDDLLDMILLVADMEKDRVRANPDRSAVGTIIESHVDKGEGPVATVLVQNGTLQRNDELAIGESVYGRVRAMKDWTGRQVNTAPPGMPVKILGFKIAPAVGDIAEVPAEGHAFKNVRKQYAGEKQQGAVVTATSGSSDAGSEGGDGQMDKKFVNIILKADVLGSLEAICGTLEKMQTTEVGVKIINKGLGNITDGDVVAAETSAAVVMGFNVQTKREAEVLARDRQVEIKKYNIIYELFDEIKARLALLVPVEITRTALGKLEVLAVFRSDKTGQVVGGRVTDGKLQVKANAVVYREADPIGEGTIVQLQAGKSDTKEVHSGQECGLKIQSKTTIHVGDIIDVFIEERKEKKFILPV